MTDSNYKFRLSLVGHKGDVRSICCISETLVISGSRDFTARSWELSEIATECHEKTVFVGHENYISAVAKVNAPEQPVLLATGSNDKVIRLFQLDNCKSTHSLEGHTDTVCALTSDEHGSLVSGSWDKTVKIWKNKQCVVTITGHQSAVWSVILMPPNCINASESDLVVVTGSADRTIRLWKISNLYTPADQPDSQSVLSAISTMTAHSDCVRALAPIDPHRFLSASNDASIRAWDTRTSECVGEFYAHTSYVYALSTQPGAALFASGGEDRCVRLWPMPSDDQWAVGRQFAQLQCIPLPCQSAWCVALSAVKSDVLVGCSDGIIRIFSTDSKRQASAAALQTYEAELASAKIAAPSAFGNGDMDPKQMLGVEALSQPGNKEGQAIVVNNDGRPTCYQWSASESRWIEIGDVVGSKSDSTTIFEGKEYDFVFTVDFAENEAPIKLPYNRTEDPWFAAQEFLHRHDLPQQYLETVAKFIITNAGLSLDTASTSHFDGPSDPLTGADRYIPGKSQATVKTDPIDEVTSNGVYFPAREFLTLKAISLEPLLSKLQSFNEHSTNPLSEETLTAIRQFTFDWDEKQAVRVAEAVLSAVDTWPIDKLFPLIDILRCLVMWRAVSRLVFSQPCWSRLHSASLGHVDLPAANCLLVLRLLTNALAMDGPTFVKAVKERVSSSLSDTPSVVTVIELSGGLKELMQEACRLQLTKLKQHQIALASLLHNMSVLAYRCLHNTTPSSDGLDGGKQLMQHLSLLPSICLRTSLHFLALGPKHGPGGVTLLHPDSVSAALICLGTAFLSIPVSQLAGNEQAVKNRRIFLLSSCAYDLQKSPTTVPDTDDDELAGWDCARDVLTYWSKALAAPRLVRQPATQLLGLLD